MPTYTKLTDGITEEVMKKAETELGETPEIRKKALEEIHLLIDKESGFVPVKEDWFLLMFLRNKKFDVKRAFKTLQNFYAFKSMYSGTITDKKPSQVKKILEMDAMVVSPLRNANGEAVAIFIIDALDHESATTFEMLAGSVTIEELILCEEVTQICGGSIVYDLKGVTFRNLMRFSTPAFCTLFARCLYNTWPCRLNSMHVINQPPYFNIAYNVIKVFLSKKIRDRVFIHGENLDALYEHIPRDILPKKVGGYLSDKTYEDFRSYLFKNEEIMEVLTKYTYNGVLYGRNDSASVD